MIKFILYFVLILNLSSCTLPNAYIINEYFSLPVGLNKTEFKRLVAERNNEISSELGYVKMYSLVHIPKNIKRNKLFLENELFENSYALSKDSLLISKNLKRLVLIKNRAVVWPSIYTKVYNTKFNSNAWTVWMSHANQQLIRDSIDRATMPILAATKYQMNPGYFVVYKLAMKLKKQKVITN